MMPVMHWVKSLVISPTDEGMDGLFCLKYKQKLIKN